MTSSRRLASARFKRYVFRFSLPTYQVAGVDTVWGATLKAVGMALPIKRPTLPYS